MKLNCKKNKYFYLTYLHSYSHLLHRVIAPDLSEVILLHRHRNRFFGLGFLLDALQRYIVQVVVDVRLGRFAAARGTLLLVLGLVFVFRLVCLLLLDLSAAEGERNLFVT